MTLPAFTRTGTGLGSKATTADIAWLGGTGVGPYFPRYLNLDYCRARGMTLHANYAAYRNSLLISTDHAVGTGFGGSILFNDIESTWTIPAAALFSGANQRETPCPVHDPIENRILVYVHDNNTNGGTYNQQHQVVLETTDFNTFAVANSNPLDYGNHTGYPQVWYDTTQAKFIDYHLMAGGEYFWWGISQSTLGETFTLSEDAMVQQSHVIGVNQCLNGAPFLFQYDDDEYYILSMLETRPALGINGTAIIAIPVYYTHGDVPRPKGGYYTLITKSGVTTDPDFVFTGDPAIYKIDGVWYVVLTGQTQAGVQHIVLYKADVSDAAYTAPAVPIKSHGRLQTPGKKTTVFDWDAANDAVPAELTITTHSGTNNSSQSAGNYYHLGTGSGSSQQLSLVVDDFLIDPTAHQVVDFTIEGLQFNPNRSSLQQHQFFMLDWDTNITNSFANLDGVMYSTSNSNPGMSYISYLNNGVVAGTNNNSYVLGVNDATATLHNYARQYGFHLTLRFQDFGTKFMTLLTSPGKDPATHGQVCFYRNLSPDALVMGDSFFGIRVQTLSSTFPETWVRFSRLTINTYATAPLRRHITRPYVGSGIGI